MEEQGVKLYPYRWVVLAVFMLINVMVQVLWICYAPIATLAAAAYGVKREDIDLLANMFMLIYIVVAFPAAWAIDTYGFKKAVGFGALLMGAFGLLRALVSHELHDGGGGIDRNIDRTALPFKRFHQIRRALVSAKTQGDYYGRHFPRACF